MRFLLLVSKNFSLANRRRGGRYQAVAFATEIKINPLLALDQGECQRNAPCEHDKIEVCQSKNS
ncbi:hypothetical protein EBQ10_03985 [Trueperella pyogenes]|uniref:Uncharacterized protein n=1 Tax=Trueperella pyogenes TaxID=1661 RepID=A0A3Q9GLU7_9ACTO|nr:hypothetical protein DC090_07260 [Trueperella pyogenes]AWG16969.1 hypothetical protein DDE06_09190 [Trueperella pyogenes]AZR02032.1 hypothetical protein EB775_01105 [Trueperella pyogenes]AZR03961.1 hypothetical protein EBQ11_01005 [Trueperella pyogenes]AZR06531.1 hypothetical protein EBQ10_03985 [Trueperella pyogenes]